jgi:hypothetical protein
MPFIAAAVVPLFILALPIILFVALVQPTLFGRDELDVLLGPCVLLLPFSAALWWIILRRVTGHRGGFVMPWVVFGVSMTAIVWWRLR